MHESHTSRYWASYKNIFVDFSYFLREMELYECLMSDSPNARITRTQL